MDQRILLCTLVQAAILLLLISPIQTYPANLRHQRLPDVYVDSFFVDQESAPEILEIPDDYFREYKTLEEEQRQQNQRALTKKGLKKSLGEIQKLLDGSMEHVEFLGGDSSSASKMQLHNPGRESASRNPDFDDFQVEESIQHSPSHRNEKKTFICDISEQTNQCGRVIITHDIEDHINTLISSNIKNLRGHVKGLKGHYEEHDGLSSADVDRSLPGTVDGDYENNKKFSINEKSLLERANHDLVTAACYLNKARTDAKLHGESLTAQKLESMLDQSKDSFNDFYCKLRVWMDSVNASISDIIEIESSQRLTDNIPNHIRKSWDYAVLTTLSEYLDRLEADMSLVKMLKEFEKS